jgi:hypothetical protein
MDKSVESFFTEEFLKKEFKLINYNEKQKPLMQSITERHENAAK